MATATSTMVELLELEMRTTFVGDRGLKNFRDPEGPPSPGQILSLWHAGHLVVTKEASDAHKFSKGEASFAMEHLGIKPPPRTAR